MKTIKYILLFICLALQFVSHAQSTTYIHYQYDAAGNRYYRNVVNLGNGRLSSNFVTDTIAKGQGDDSNSNMLNEPLMDKFLSHDITVYPNPTEGKLQLDISNIQIDENISVMIYDLSGKTYYLSSKAISTTEINLFDKPSGIYFMKISVGQKEQIWKIIKQ